MYHHGTWIVWLVAAAVPAFTLHNPLYSVLVLGAAWIVYAVLGRTSPTGSSWGSFVKLGVLLFTLTIPFNALSIHVGRIVLFRLPQGLPIVGGAITLESVIAGAVSGLALLTILVVFAAFNAVVDHYQLLRATPAFLFQAGVVVSVAITFVPQMVLSARQIREAQRIRGHRFRGLRDLLPLILPLLASGLERAIQLAEAMESRGFASAVAPVSGKQATFNQLRTLAALLGLLAGLFIMAYFSDRSLVGWGLAAAGSIGLLATFWLQGKRVQRSRYRTETWSARDLAVAAASLVVVAAVLSARQFAPETLVYTPYPPYPLLPPFSPLVGAALLLLALPAALPSGRNRQAAGQMEHTQ
jgi:energy-coupling factor transport system permease protein